MIQRIFTVCFISLTLIPAARSFANNEQNAHSDVQNRRSPCADREIARAYSSKESPDSARYLRFFQNQTASGFELNIHDCPHSSSEGFPAFSHVSYLALQQAFGKILSAKIKQNYGYSLSLFSDLRVLEILFAHLVAKFRTIDCEEAETFPIDMYSFQIDSELTELFPSHSAASCEFSSVE